MNYYEILGIKPDATDQQIKEAYRREAMKWHPDRHDGAAAKGEATRRFKDLAAAYRTLRNPVDRANYDLQLEQKLRQEYDARQKEQARQKQARQEPPRQDFADTGPQFEDQTASNDDANQMFYEQMLDLALELAGRGFPEFNIFKALIALGCPEALAKAVAAVAAEKVQSGAGKAQSSSNTKSNSTPRQTDDLQANIGKEEYYKAALGAKNQDYFLEKFRRFDQMGTAGFSWPSAGQFFAGVFWLFYRQMTSSALLYLGLPFVLLFLLYLMSGPEIKDDSLPMSIYNIITAAAYWLYLPARMNAIYYNYINKNILSAKSKASDITSQLAILKKRGGTSSVIGWLVLIPIVGILAAVALPAYQDYTRRAQVATGFVLGYEAAQKIGDYYVTQKKGPGDLGAAGISFVPSKTVKDVAFDSQTGVLTISFQDDFFNAKSLLLVPTVADGKVTWLCTSTGIATQHLPHNCRATQEAANARLAAINAEAQSNDKAKSDYARVLATIEAQHPELNPDSAMYSSASLDWVATRKTFHQGRGQTPTNSLQLAVTDYASALQQQQRNQSVTSTQQPRKQDSAAYFGGVGQKVSLNFQNIDIRALLQVFADTSGHRFIADDQITGGIDIRVVDQPWTLALMEMLQNNQLAIIKIQTGYYVFPKSFSDDTANRRASQSLNAPNPKSNHLQQIQNVGGISQKQAGETLCQTWPSACR